MPHHVGHRFDFIHVSQQTLIKQLAGSELVHDISQLQRPHQESVPPAIP